MREERKKNIRNIIKEVDLYLLDILSYRHGEGGNKLDIYLTIRWFPCWLQPYTGTFHQDLWYLPILNFLSPLPIIFFTVVEGHGLCKWPVNVHLRRCSGVANLFTCQIFSFGRPSPPVLKSEGTLAYISYFKKNQFWRLVLTPVFHGWIFAAPAAVATLVVKSHIYS